MSCLCLSQQFCFLSHVSIHSISLMTCFSNSYILETMIDS